MLQTAPTTQNLALQAAPSRSLWRTSQSLLTITALAALTACASFTHVEQKATLAPAPNLSDKALASDNAAANAQWWTVYGDAQLSQLVTQALANNPNLRVAQARLVKVQTAVDSANTLNKPQITGSVDATHQRYTKNGLIPAPLAGTERDTGTVQASASWELDLFGKNRAALEAAIGQSRAMEADTASARLLLASNVARNYMQWVRVQRQLQVAQRTLEQRQQLLQLVQDRVQAGLDTQLELQQAQSGLPEARYQIEVLQEQADLLRNALTALTGQKTAVELDTQASLATKTIANTSLASIDQLPLDLLGRRPDIVAARWRVEAASHDVSNAKTLFYPNINLTAFAGYSSLGFDKVFDNNSQQWGYGPAIRLPLFEGGRLRANLKGKAADLDAAIETYNGLVLDAVRDVADQLTSAQSLQRQQAEQAQAQKAAEAAYTVAVQRYEAGLGNYLQVLNAESAVLTQRRLAVDLHARQTDTELQLIRALGGGYQASALPATQDNS
ncbi:efflux transporter outer membrane subunit [Curvibacter sp. CHRR-16]|uniref:efflux transporter outer membrane subunit n=1 Tax=Curvibacter sp. CHRR-16 TaxID=2835872 RepID=UPI001BD96ABE|nr:efflux transporter outer membrane subunit [Curvibacter sp. CHRR-16]MBT0568932.1 efflux transporter outer membrane subunit [Curvibacter sp. CHRR-16]